MARSHGALMTSEQRLGANQPGMSSVALSRAELRASVTAHTRRLRDEGVTPERVLAEVKQSAHEQLSPTLGTVEMRDLVADVVRWTIDAYYDRSSPEQPS